MDIQAAVVRKKSGRFELEFPQLDEPLVDEILVKISGASICHTDIICRDLYCPIPMPVVFGHEGSGMVVKVGATVTKITPGDHVVLTYMNCGI